MRGTFEQNGKTYQVTGIKDSPLRMVKEIYKCKDAPSGYYSTGPTYYIDKTGKTVFTQ